MKDSIDFDTIATAVRRWVETVVVDLNLCPFAGKELRRGRIRFAVSPATTESELLNDLQTELEWLDTHPGTETTLLIHPRVLRAFDDYNQFLQTADDLLDASGMVGIYQIASFHPDYRFAGTAAEDAENYTNRAPFPMLHLLREETLERSIASYPDTNEIPQRNIALMERLGTDHLKQLLRDCFE